MFMTDQQSAKLPEPGVGSFYDPAALVAAEFASIFIPSFLVVLAIRGNQFDAPLSEPPTQRIGIVPGIGDYALRFCRGRPRDCGTETSASVVSASVISAGEALSS